jgi:hypothetical protein
MRPLQREQHVIVEPHHQGSRRRIADAHQGLPATAATHT